MIKNIYILRQMFHMPSLENRDGGYRSFMVPTCTAVGKFTIILYVLHPKYAIQIDIDTIRVLHSSCLYVVFSIFIRKVFL